MTNDHGTTRVALRGYTYEVHPRLAVWIVVDQVTRRAIAGGVTGSHAAARRRVKRSVERLVAARIHGRPTLPRSWQKPAPESGPRPP